MSDRLSIHASKNSWLFEIKLAVSFSTRCHGFMVGWIQGVSVDDGCLDIRVSRRSVCWCRSVAAVSCFAASACHAGDVFWLPDHVLRKQQPAAQRAGMNSPDGKILSIPVRIK